MPWRFAFTLFLRAPIVRVHTQYTRTGAPCKRYLLYCCDMFFVWLTLPCGRPRCCPHFPHRGQGRCLVQIKTQAVAFLIGQVPFLPGIVFDPELPRCRAKSKAAIRQAPPKALTISTMQRSTERKSYFQRWGLAAKYSTSHPSRISLPPGRSSAQAPS